MPFSDGSEPAIIERLRTNGQMTLALVAECDGKVVGQINFSPVTLSHRQGQWIGLGPVAVQPNLQGMGIGGQLIRAGLAQIKAKGADGCVLIGNPEIYSRFGFRNRDGLTYGSLAQEKVQYLAFKDEVPKGEIIFASAFD
jgi:putative acetyltransferase